VIRPLGRMRLVTIVLVASAAAACSGSSEGTSSAPSTVTVATPTPALPKDVNPRPYEIGDLAGLGDAQIRVVAVRDPDRTAGSRTEGRPVSVDVELRNGALGSVAFELSSFRLYDASGSSYVPDSEAFGTLTSDQLVRRTLRFEVRRRAEVVALVFDGSRYERVNSGAFSLVAAVGGTPG
jgi:hypothetical protein